MEQGPRHIPENPTTKRLQAIGIPMDDIHLLQSEIAHRQEEQFHSHSFHLYSGNYDVQFDREGFRSIYPAPHIQREKTTKIKRGLLRKTVDVTTPEEVKLIPEDIAEQTTQYARSLIGKKDGPVRIVDFGAGSGLTVCRAANLLAEEIGADKVSIMATNYESAPQRLDEIEDPAIRRMVKGTTPPELSDALENRRIQFEKANIVDIHG